MVNHKGPFFYAWNNIPRDEVVVTFFQTNPPTLIAERGDQTSLMYRQPNGGGAKYQGRNASFWDHGGEALITWDYQNPEMLCIRSYQAKQEKSPKNLFISLLAFKAFFNARMPYIIA